MKKEIETLVNSLREKSAGKTCMGTGNFSFDIITQREYPNGFVVGKRNRFEEKILAMEIGNTCGNVMTMLPYLGVKTFPVAKLDVSPQGFQMKRDMKAYGADVRFVSNTLTGGTTILRCMHKLDNDGKPTMGHKGSTAGKPWTGLSARPCRKYLSSKGGEVEALVDSMDFIPDVFFFDVAQAGHRILAERLREKGSLVYFECDSDGHRIENEKSRQAAHRLFLRCVEASDVVKMSGEYVQDLSFADAYTDKLFVQTLGADGLRFKLGGGQWIKLAPVVNPDYKDYEGAGDWTSTTLIAALCSMDMLKVKDMTEEAVREALTMAQQMASYSVGFYGSKGLIHADDGFKLQGDTLDMPRYTKKLMYLHGSASAGFSRTSMGILKYLPQDWQLLTPDCPVDAEECLKMLKDLCEQEKPDLIIGSSQGGYYAQMLRGYKRICVNPALDMSNNEDVKVGNHQFVVNREDGVQRYVITPEMQEGYRRLEAHQFEGITDFDREYCYGLFGDHDTDYGHCKPLFAEHYKHIHSFPGGHKMEYDEIEKYLMPLVQELINR
jgi:predicted esterase YcpF (UPF0227 family)/sugar/nucleoside kinase (ribokinase family)